MEGRGEGLGLGASRSMGCGGQRRVHQSGVAERRPMSWTAAWIRRTLPIALMACAWFGRWMLDPETPRAQTVLRDAYSGIISLEFGLAAGEEVRQWQGSITPSAGRIVW